VRERAFHSRSEGSRRHTRSLLKAWVYQDWRNITLLVITQQRAGSGPRGIDLPIAFLLKFVGLSNWLDALPCF
jgi:hypothetical protein